MTSSKRFYSILGLVPGCSAGEARRAYYRLAKRYHPDTAGSDDERRKQLAMIRINEAYVGVLADLTSGEDETGDNAHDRESSRRQEAPPAGHAAGADFFRRWERKAYRGPAAATTAVGALRDPAYVYYKAGFRAYNQGSSMLYRKEGRELRKFLQTGGTFDAYVLGLVLQALQLFEQSYRYFLVVVEQYPNSPWCADARWKLHRLQRYNAIYQRICENLSRRSSIRRSSFSMVAGAHPS